MGCAIILYVKLYKTPAAEVLDTYLLANISSIR